MLFDGFAPKPPRPLLLLPQGSRKGKKLQDLNFPSLELVGIRPVFLRASFLRAFQEVIEWRKKVSASEKFPVTKQSDDGKKGNLWIISSWIRIQDSHRISDEG